MKIAAKYTLVLGGTLAIVLAVLGFVRLHYVRAQLEEDMRHDHNVVGRVLQASIADLWRDAAPDRAQRETVALLERSSAEVKTTTFRWEHGDAKGSQRIEGAMFVSRFPVVVGATPVGSIVARESLSVIDAQVRTDAWFSAGGIAVIVIVCLVAARLMGGWLVGRPVGMLVEQARKIGRRELGGEVPFRRSDELGQLADELRSASVALSSSLEQMRHSDRLATVGKLAAGIAHELGTPLSIVGGHAQMIAGGEVTGDAALASARAIDAEAGRMGKIVRQLLDFARRKGPEGTTCDPNAIVRRCASLLEVMAEKHRVQCEIVESAAPVRALIDEDSLQQVLTNLIVNAIQAMPEGGKLVVTVAANRPRVEITVRDTGPGMADEVKAHMFEPFFTTKAPGDGTGLGLAVVHGIVSDHKGTIDVDSSAHGTTFVVSLEEAA
jgi:two-component system, NtrC family, sensor kinase